MSKTLMVNVDTGKCLGCGKRGNMDVTVIGYTSWRKGAYIQDAMPELTAGQREQLISGMHEPCFDEMFKEEEE